MAWTEHLTEKPNRGRLPTAGVSCHLNYYLLLTISEMEPKPSSDTRGPKVPAVQGLSGGPGQSPGEDTGQPLADSLSIARLGPLASARLGSDTACSANLSPLLSLAPLSSRGETMD